METDGEGKELATLLYDGEEFEVPVELLQDVSMSVLLTKRQKLYGVASIRILASLELRKGFIILFFTRKLFSKKY